MTNTSVQATFAGGLNGVAAAHTLTQNEVQSCLNIDFSLELGALIVRRGCATYGALGASSAVSHIARNYTGGDAGPWYAVGGSYIGSGTPSGGAVTLASIAPATGSGHSTQYQNKTYIAAGSNAIWDDGTQRFNWLIESPVSAPVVSLNTGNGAFTGVTGTWTASEGSVTSATGSPLLSTCTTGTGSRITLTGGVISTNTNWDNPQTFTQAGLYHSGTKTSTIGPYGVDYLFLSFSVPSAVVRISRDVSIGDATFANYWHAEATLDSLDSGQADPLGLALSVNTDQQRAISDAQNKILAASNPAPFRGRPVAKLAPIIGSTSPWAVPRSSYSFVGSTTAPGWTNCQAVRVIIECTGTTSMVIGGWQTWGSLMTPLVDTVNGYQYYYTLARVESGVVVAEGGPGPASPATRIQAGVAQIVIGPYNGEGTSGATYYGIYRQGGLLSDAYLVDYMPIGTSTSTGNFITSDQGYPDLMIVNSNTLVRNLLSTWPTAGVSAVSEPFQERIFLGTANTLMWTSPGQPGQIPTISEAVVSNQGDNIQGIVVWNRLVIVNQASVYEMDGTQFEGVNQDWVLRRSGSRRGSAAPKTIIKTPYGILLMGYDGLSLYNPGYGIDEALEWVTEKIGDAWRGTGTNDPVATKGNRLLAINLGSISNSCAAFADGKIYLAFPHSANTLANAMYVLDMARKTATLYTYHFNITSLYWDYILNRLVAGTDLGKLYQLEVGHQDIDGTGAATPILWNTRTRNWTTSNDMVLEEFQVEEAAGNGSLYVATTIDGTSTLTSGTFTNATKSWQTVPLGGTVANNVNHVFVGTQSGSNQQGVWGYSWDALVQPSRSVYDRTELDSAGHPGEKIWDVHYTEIDIQGTGTVTGVTFVDNVGLLTNTYVGPSTVSQTPFPFPYGVQTGALAGTGPVLIPSAFPVETYGNVAYSTYTTGTFTALTFKLYNSYNMARPEPPRVASYATPRFTAKHAEGTECFWHAVNAELNCLGASVVGTVYVDETVVGTFTSTGSGRQVYHYDVPSETYGNVVYVRYAAASGVFKHYDTFYQYTEEPTRCLFAETLTAASVSEQYIKTWVSELNPLGGVVIGSLYVDGVVVAGATFTGTLRHTFEVGAPNVTTGKSIKATYSSATPFRAYNIQGRDPRCELEAKPFNKLEWLVTYKRVGGATQADMGRFYSLDVEGTVNGTLTSTWLVDGTAIETNTLTLTQPRQYFDMIVFPPGIRGYLFQQQITSTTPFKVWRSNIDIERIGVKGFSRVSFNGVPQ